MGLKVERDDSLDRRFDDLAILPNDPKQKVEKNDDIQRFLKPQPKEKESKKK